MRSRSRVPSQGSQSCPCALIAESLTKKTRLSKISKSIFAPADLQNLETQALKDIKERVCTCLYLLSLRKPGSQGKSILYLLTAETWPLARGVRFWDLKQLWGVLILDLDYISTQCQHKCQWLVTQTKTEHSYKIHSSKLLLITSWPNVNVNHVWWKRL